MTKRFSGLFAGMLAVFSLAGCGDLDVGVDDGGGLADANLHEGGNVEPGCPEGEVCEFPLHCPENCSECAPPASCPIRCGCNPTIVCGDQFCREGETCEECPADCGVCPEIQVGHAEDWHPVCGDLTCNGDETCEDCPADCGQCAPNNCGDGICEEFEACGTCPDDCGRCDGTIPGNH